MRLREEKRIRLLFALRDGSFEKKPHKFLPLLLDDSQLQHEFLYVLFSEMRIDSAQFIKVIEILNKCEEDARRNGTVFLKLKNELGLDRTAIHMAILNNQTLHVIERLLVFGVNIDQYSDIDTLCLGYPDWESKLPKMPLITLSDLAVAANRPDVLELLVQHDQKVVTQREIQEAKERSALTEEIEIRAQELDRKINSQEVQDFFALLGSVEHLLEQKAAELDVLEGSVSHQNNLALEVGDPNAEDLAEVCLTPRGRALRHEHVSTNDELKEEVYKEQPKKLLTNQYSILRSQVSVDKAKMVHTHDDISVLKDGTKLVHNGHVSILEDGTKVVHNGHVSVLDDGTKLVHGGNNNRYRNLYSN